MGLYKKTVSSNAKRRLLDTAMIFVNLDNYPIIHLLPGMNEIIFAVT